MTFVIMNSLLVGPCHGLFTLGHIISPVPHAITVDIVGNPIGRARHTMSVLITDHITPQHC